MYIHEQYEADHLKLCCVVFWCTCMLHLHTDQSTETLLVVINNMEGRECLCRLNRVKKPKHPRSSTSDDMECFFSMMCDVIGQNFTAKQVQ